MRKYLLLSTCLLGSLVAKTQIQKGNILLGGTGAVFLQQSASSSSTTLQLIPNSGVFITDNIALGATIRFGVTYSKSYDAINVGLSPFARFYFFQQEKTTFFAALSGGVYNDSYKPASTINKTIYAGYSGSAGIGSVYFLTPNIGFESILRYSRSTSSNNLTANSNSYSSNLGIFFGFQFFLDRQDQSPNIAP
jgi:hypothetical protein